MRKIKFRGMAVVNDKHNNIKVGDFVHGSYIESNVDAPCIIWGDGEQIEIDRKTLGQCIGLKDEHGVDIYEGDTFERTDGDGWVIGDHLAIMDGDTLSIDERTIGSIKDKS